MITAIILAAGKSKRFPNKLFEPLRGKSVLFSAIACYENHPAIGKIVIVANRGNKKRVQMITAEFKKVRAVLIGGATRQKSAAAAITGAAFMPSYTMADIAIIHNGANPLVTPKEITQCINTLRRNKNIDGVAVGRPVTNTVKRVDGRRSKGGSRPALTTATVRRTLDRHALYEMETPQAVRLLPFAAAHRKARAKKFTTTDDIGLLEWYGRKTAVIPAADQNRKITNPLDLAAMRVMVGDADIRIGYGEDAHMVDRRHRGLHLGGLYLPQYSKLRADSDGDVVLHALASAISQALGGGSLGTFAAPLFEKGITHSAEYLKHQLNEHQPGRNGQLTVPTDQQFIVQHVGISVECAEPKIDPLVPRMQKKLANLLSITPEQISITAHTNNGLTPCGRGEGIRCVAIITLQKCP